MTQLAVLRRKLLALRRRRRLKRLVCGTAPLGTGCLVWLLAVFWLDLFFELDAVQRTVAAGLGVLLLYWYLRRAAWPFLTQRETPLQAALDVERLHGLDNQLVAALQFERSAGARASSPQLEQAVIGEARAIAGKLETLQGFEYRPLFQRSLLLIVSVSTTLALAASFPAHTTAFLKRLSWQAARYPTETTIERVVINNQEVLVRSMNQTMPRAVGCAEGYPVDFQVRTSGSVAEQGQLRLMTAAGQPIRTLPLQLNAPGRQVQSGVAEYRGSLRRLVAPSHYQIHVGDAWTDLAEIQMIARPIVDLSVRLQPPAYTGAGSSIEPSLRQLAVLEGSRLHFQVDSLNGKRLRSVTLSCKTDTDSSTIQFVPSDQAGLRWESPRHGTLFEDLQQDVRFELRVTDEDGLGLTQPWKGRLAVSFDRGPTVVIGSIHRVVLPRAKPAIRFQATDDYAISSAILRINTQRAASGRDRGEETTPSRADEFDTEYVIPLERAPVTSNRLPLEGEHQLDLTPLDLQPGDRLTVTLEVQDARGNKTGLSTVSEPLVLQVTDEQGVFDALARIDEQTEQALSDVIRRQQEVGGK